jgi:hypothetical protein
MPRTGRYCRCQGASSAWREGAASIAPTASETKPFDAPATPRRRQAHDDAGTRDGVVAENRTAMRRLLELERIAGGGGSKADSFARTLISQSRSV